MINFKTGAVDGSTLAVEYGYGTDYAGAYYHRLNYLEYPDNRKIWNGYTHSGTTGTLQDTINDVFNRVGQIAKDNSGAIGNILAEYDLNGLGRFVRRVHDEDSGKYGNDTRSDLWHGTTGDYDGLDRFGRIVDYKFTNFNGTAYDFERRKYGYDRNSNRTHIEHTLYKASSHSATYDNLDRLTNFKTGTLDGSNVVQLSDAVEGLNMDLLGNFTATPGGIKLNGTTTTISHAVNETNEITSISHTNPAGSPTILADQFTSSINSVWTQDKGTWSISSGEVNVDTLTSSAAVLIASPDLDIVNTQVKVKFPTGSSTARAGIAFAHDGNNNYYLAIINRNTGNIELRQVTAGTTGSALTSAAVSISDNTQYTLSLIRKQRHTEIRLGSVTCTYDSATDFGTGLSGLYSNTVNVKFDDLGIRDATVRPSLVPGIVGLADASIVSGELLVQETTRGGEAIIQGFGDDNYMVTADVKTNSGTDADIWVRYTDGNNGYRVSLTAGGNMAVVSMDRGTFTSVATNTYTTAASVAVKIKVNGTSIKVWVDGTLKINTTDSTHAAGAVALGGDQPKFDNLQVGYDNNADDDIIDVGDDVVRNFTFASTSVTVSHDHTGNLIDDGYMVYIYDAWNRLVKVRASNDADVILQQAEFDGMGRRIRKQVQNSGDLDGTTVYLYDGQKIIETRNGSGTMISQFIHGTQYIDELVMERVKDKGDFYIHQDANWNVIATTDQGGKLMERYEYTPYGELTVHQMTSFGDRDGDRDVDSTDKGTVGSTCTGTVSGTCRILDLDFDGDYDATDATKFDALTQGISRHPGRGWTGTSQTFAHQGLVFDAEIGSYQNRARQYEPAGRRFMQRDPLGIRAPRGFTQSRARHNGLRALEFPLIAYADGLNDRLALRSQPLVLVDPLGLCGTGDNPPECECSDVNGPDGPCGGVRCDGGGGFIICINEAAPPENCGSEECMCAHEESHLGCNTDATCDGVPPGDPPNDPLPPADPKDPWYGSCQTIECHMQISCSHVTCEEQNGGGGPVLDELRRQCHNFTVNYAALCDPSRPPPDTYPDFNPVMP